MLEFLKKKWIEWLISVTLVVITVILTNNFTVRRESKAAIQKQLDEKASIKYVDAQDQNILKILENQAEEAKETNKMQTELIKSVDGKLNILISRPK